MNTIAVKGMKEEMQKNAFAQIYEQAIEKAIDIAGEAVNQIKRETGRDIMSGISGRVKSPESIVRKLTRKEYPPTFSYAVTKLNDLAGIRVTCYFLDDVALMADFLKIHKDIRFVKEKDYIHKPKSSGYKSLHLIIEIPVETHIGEQWIKVEIQLRTIAMDFWARLDHRLCYKKELKEAQEVKKELREYADIISLVDRQMLTLRQKIDAL